MPVGSNLFEQDFELHVPCQKWIEDITYVPTSEGRLYSATVIDLISRRVVCWVLSDRMTEQLAINATNIAIINEPQAAGLIFHSGGGSQYASNDFQDSLREHNS